ncbi:Ribosome assembly protein 1 [Penicillium citrinum]|uniref:Ribosome assembly protein 1 n=2 Tax=Penicillium TaxID=5073 RepID=A0A9W9TW95_PENCI|nr:Ribosome assembly protein 1 [Penicillium citrinum]KAJ5243024.1 Ribosome assembly protein 1 [Penicillium citrinum]KAJ5599472.1 Ribosome assembly protein 1 [Penicillium hetheringtonii]
MPVVNVDDLVRLQRKPEDIRNICILAHVDHGKTSLTDSLIATNGIISPKLAGKIRYLDSRPDEQLRGITMESSAISLFFSMLRRPAPEAAPVPKEYLINLIDSPGHIDFSSEVSTASRLCDGAIVLVDAVEGVCSQTVTVLRQSWVEQLKPILVINKMDRLVSELMMSPSEAFSHLSRLLEQVNAVIGSFYQGERMEEDLQWRERMEDRANAASAKDKSKSKTVDDESTQTVSEATEFEERDDEDLYFAPEKNNVIFCSAVDGWAFTIRQFAAIYEKKLGIKRTVLEKVLWGDYYLDPKTKRVLGQKHLKGRPLKPMFVQLVLDSIWAAYEATTGGGKGKGDPVLLEKITKSLNINIPPYILRSRDPKNIMTTLFSQWLPLSTAVLVSVIEYLPSPPAAQAARLPDMIESSPGSKFVSEDIKKAMVNFKTEPTEPVVAYVSKMAAIPESELSSSKKRGGGTMTADEAREIARRKREEIAKMQAEAGSGKEDEFSRMHSAFESASLIRESEETEDTEEKEDPEHLIGFARLFSGTLSVGDEIYVLPPKFSPATPHESPEPRKVTVTDLYLLMGRSLEPLQSVPAGVVFGIGGLAGYVLKTGTLCSQVEGSINLAGVSLNTPPIVRVALEPVNPADLSKMVTGLRLLEQSDPCAQYEVLPSGEHVILTAGELHLERCVKDLIERFARCEIQTGEAIVPYRETIVEAPEMAAPKDSEMGRGGVCMVSGSKQMTIRLRVLPLPEAVTDFLTKQVGTIKKLHSDKRSAAEETSAKAAVEGDGQAADGTSSDAAGEAREGNILSLKDFRSELEKIYKEAGESERLGKDLVEKIIAFGPRRVGPNILVDATAVNTCDKFLVDEPKTNANVADDLQAHVVRDLCDKIAYAFQLATGQGPLCQEPMQGIAVFLEDISVQASSNDELDMGRLTGDAIRLVREGISQGFLDWSPRVMLAMYSCEIQATTEVLGRVYGVITRRRGRIISEVMKEGTPFFTIMALLPVAESFGFAEEIRKRTSGAAQPQLIFAGFEALDEDPFWVPATEEELEDLGELADKENVAKRYMDAVRSRKGLVVQGRKLIDAEKQKTLKK